MIQQFRMITITAGWLVILFAGIYLVVMRYEPRGSDEFRIGIRLTDDDQRAIAQQFLGEQHDLSRASYVEFTAGWKEFFALQQAGLQPELVVAMEAEKLFHHGFHRLAQVDSILDHLNQSYPTLTRLLTIGSSAFWNLPIGAIRISALPLDHGDAPSLLLTAAHHANEPIGVEICLQVMNYLCHNYQVDSQVQSWLNAAEVWIVPVVNPDGYRMVFSDSGRLIWRKNLRDNNGDGRFSPDCDGVDLNRNYDHHWGIRGEHLLQSNFYCGPMAFSEPEIRAIHDLVQQRRFALHLDFHSAGEKVLFPAGKAGPQQLVALANVIASQIKRNSAAGHYRIAPLHDWLGQCSPWMFFQIGVPSLLIEAGDSYFPSEADLSAIVEQNSRAVYKALDLLSNRKEWIALLTESPRD